MQDLASASPQHSIIPISSCRSQIPSKFTSVVSQHSAHAASPSFKHCMPAPTWQHFVPGGFSHVSHSPPPVWQQPPSKHSSVVSQQAACIGGEPPMHICFVGGVPPVSQQTVLPQLDGSSSPGSVSSLAHVSPSWQHISPPTVVSHISPGGQQTSVGPTSLVGSTLFPPDTSQQSSTMKLPVPSSMASVAISFGGTSQHSVPVMLGFIHWSFADASQQMSRNNPAHSLPSSQHSENPELSFKQL